MRAAHATALAAVLLAGCQLPAVEAGKPPEGPTRDAETALERRQRARAGETADAGDASGEEPASAQARTGTPATRRYHRADCAELAKAGAGGRVEFTNAWAALDADFAPCPVCSPGP